MLIDDYNSTEHLLDIDGFLSELASMGGEPDFYSFEGDMGAYRDQMLDSIEDQRTLNSYTRYINGKNHMPCSFMTAIWYLIRLGYFEADDTVIRNKRVREKFELSDYLINILPSRFKGVEAKAIDLIKATKYREAANNIEQIFFDTKICKK